MTFIFKYMYFSPFAGKQFNLKKKKKIRIDFPFSNFNDIAVISIVQPLTFGMTQDG